MADNEYEDIDYSTYDDPETPDTPEVTPEEDKKKRRNIIIVVVLVILALIIALLVFLGNRDTEETPEPGEDTTTSDTVTMPDTPDMTGAPEPDLTTEPETTDDPDANADGPEEVPFDEDRAPEPRYKPEPETPLPTTPNQEYAEAHGNPFDPRSGLPKEVSEMAVSNMFSLTVTPDASFEDNFYRAMEGRMSPTMEATGFKPWWPKDGPEHTIGYRSMMNSLSTSRIYAFPELKSEKRIANDIIQFHYKVPQRIQSPQGYTNISSFEVVVDMIGDEDGTWLVHDYYFPDGKVPSIH